MSRLRPRWPLAVGVLPLVGVLHNPIKEHWDADHGEQNQDPPAAATYVAQTPNRTRQAWNDDGTTQSVAVPGTSAGVGCLCARPLSAMDGRLFIAMYSDETGSEFAYLDEPTYGLPGTNRDGSVWSTALVLLAAITAVAGVGLRMRGASRS